jgi:hypothetical protein
MDKPANDIDLIEKFLEGSLSETETKIFNDLLKSDIDFADRLAKRKLLQESYTEATRQYELKKHIRSIVIDEKQNSAFRKRIWLVAASLILLVGIGSLIVIQTRQSGNSNTIAEVEGDQKEDKIVEGKKNNIEEFASIDTFTVVKKKAISFLPPDGAVFSQSDTIRFFWNKAVENNILILKDKAGSEIRKIAIKPGTTEYKLSTNDLKPGTYNWSFSHDISTTHSFIIK